MNPHINEIKEEIALINALYEAIKAEPNECVMDIIQEFCFDNNQNLEYIGSLISSNKSLKDYVENNLRKFKFIQDIKPQ